MIFLYYSLFLLLNNICLPFRLYALTKFLFSQQCIDFTFQQHADTLTIKFVYETTECRCFGNLCLGYITTNIKVHSHLTFIDLYCAFKVQWTNDIWRLFLSIYKMTTTTTPRILIFHFILFPNAIRAYCTIHFFWLFCMRYIRYLSIYNVVME